MRAYGSIMKSNDIFRLLEENARMAGASKTALIKTEEIVFDSHFRQMCESNSCGIYGRSHSCPPAIGEANDLIDNVKSYRYAFIYQTVSTIEDSFDIEGMGQARLAIFSIASKLSEITRNVGINALHLSAGACSICERCTKIDGLPCRFPNLMISSLEAHCIDVTSLARASDMRYTNGDNTVTYFGAVFF